MGLYFVMLVVFKDVKHHPMSIYGVYFVMPVVFTYVKTSPHAHIWGCMSSCLLSLKMLNTHCQYDMTGVRQDCGLVNCHLTVHNHCLPTITKLWLDSSVLTRDYTWFPNLHTLPLVGVVTLSMLRKKDTFNLLGRKYQSKSLRFSWANLKTWSE